MHAYKSWGQQWIETLSYGGWRNQSIHKLVGLLIFNLFEWNNNTPESGCLQQNYNR